MAESKDTMARLERLEQDVADIKGAIAQIVPLLVSHDERLGRIDARLEQMDARFERMDARFERMDERFQQITDRLDRLIHVTIVDKTAWAERFLDMERRLARLEERVGI
jgi:hypothetical protein